MFAFWASYFSGLIKSFVKYMYLFLHVQSLFKNSTVMNDRNLEWKVEVLGMIAEDQESS